MIIMKAHTETKIKLLKSLSKAAKELKKEIKSVRKSIKLLPK